jgi:acyl carrier protein/NADP-dependent 3-hydroxy acid dehydrogenase YdfG
MADPALSHALQVTQDSLTAFQRMQEQTAQLHRQFLETQESAQRTLQVLVEGQQRLLAASLGIPVAGPAPLPASPPPMALPAPAPARDVEEAVPATSIPLPPPPATPVAHAPGSPGLSPDRVQQVLLAVVAEKTGYPPEMLNPDMGLDADLGIDSIKRVEILSALQEKLPDAPAVKPEHLGTLHTLRQIVEFLCSSEPEALATDNQIPVAHASGSVSLDRVLPVLLAIVADKTGYPPEMIDPDMGLDADLGIDSIKRVEILSALQEQLPETPAVKPEHLGTLHTLRQIAEFLCSSESAVGAGSVSDGTIPPSLTLPARMDSLDRRVLRVVPLTANRPALKLTGDAWLVGGTTSLVDRLAGRGLSVRTFAWDDTPPSAPAALGGLILVAPPTGDNVASQGFRWLRTAGPALRQSASAVFATVTHLDGAFGLSDAGPRGDAEAGALAGLAKTVAHEWPTVVAKAIDVDPALDPTAAADAVADELHIAGAAEVGIGSNRRVTLELVHAPLADAVSPFGPGDVVVLTGGARGVTAEVAVAIAAGRPTLVLLGRSAEPAAEPSELTTCADEASLKRALAGQMAGATPRQVAERCQAVLAGREVRRTLDCLTAAGARAVYRSVDVRDAADVAGILAEVRRTVGPVTGVVHGAGVLADRKIDDQTDEQFATVYSTKVEGLKAVLAATATDPLKLVAVFSSSTGRFGRAGQVAYAAANEAVNKLAQAEARRRPRCRVVAVNWGPWEGGMVTPALRGVFAAEGIGLIPLAAGARHMLAEMAAADRSVETVVLGPAPESSERTPGGQVGSDLSVAFERDLTLDTHPILAAHVIDGRAVVPMALTVEWLAHAALHGNPGLTFAGLNELRIFQPVTVHESVATPVRVHAGRAVRRDGQSLVTAEVRGLRADGREVVHSRAEVILVGALPPAPAVGLVPDMSAYPLDPDDVYQRVLFHGPELRGLDQVIGCGPAGIVIVAQTAPAPAAWVRQPLRGQWIADPLALDCAFQAMSIWCHAERGAVSLPSALGRYRQYVRRFPAGVVRVICRVTSAAGPVVRAEVEFVADNGKLIAGIDGFECVLDAALNTAFRRNRLAGVGV